MGSPISFSGFNQIDFTQILNMVMQQERGPLTEMEARKTTLETQSTTFGTLLTKITAVETAVTELGESTSLATLIVGSSDDGVGATATKGTIEGAYDVVVTQLARAQVTASSSTYASVDAEVATGGTLSLLVAGQPPVNIVLAGSMTLRQLAAAINDKTDSPVSASVVQAAPGSYRLVLTGRNTGVDSAFTMTSTLTGGQGLGFADPGGNGVFGEVADVNAQDARNALLTVNNLAVTSAKNTVEDVIPGVTLTLTREDATRTATVSVKRDNTSVVKTIEKFTTAYNDLVAFFKDQNTAGIAGKANIARDPVLRSLRDSLRTALSAEYPDGDGNARLASAGIEFDTTGKLKVNKTKLEAAMKESASSVQRLFSGVGGVGGAFNSLKTLLGNYTKSGGIVATVRLGLGQQVSNISKRLDTMESRLLVRRNSLQREYIAADMAMTQLKAQSSSLSAVGSQYRLF